MTFQRKLLLGASLMLLPILLVGVEAIRSNALEQRALEVLGQSLARTRTYSEVETAIFNQSEVVWRYLTGLDPGSREEFRMAGEVVNYWFRRWQSELQPDEMQLAEGVKRVHQDVEAVSDSVFRLYDAGNHAAAYRMAQTEVKGRLQPELTRLNREIYRRAREFSVQRAFARVEEIVTNERRVLLMILLASVAAGLLASWLVARSLARPINELRRVMAVVGAGDLDYPINADSQDEIGDLARAFAQMTASLRHSSSEMVRLNDELAAKIGQLERTQAQLLQSEKLAAIGEMSAAVAHGLRNPLASLRAAAQLAQLHPDSPAAREQLTAIISEVDRLDRRISHLLTFSRPAPFYPVAAGVAALVESVLPAVAKPLQDHGVSINLDLAPDLPDVKVDSMKMEQVLLEILSNALDAMPGGGRITIKGRVVAAPNRESTAGVSIAISDTGRGIAEATMPSVFDPFFTTRPEGTGLGLAIAKRFIEQHQGRLELTSRPGEGTTVTLWLPL